MAFLVYYLLGFAGIFLTAKILMERIRNKELAIHRSRIRDFEKFLHQFVELTANDGWLICDENLLPHPKEDIFKSYLIVRRRDSLSADRVEDIKMKLVHLSCFQKKIGDEPIANPIAAFLRGGSKYIDGQSSLELSRQISSVEPEVMYWADLQTLSLVEARLYLDTISAEIAPPLKCESQRLFLVADTVLEVGGSILKAAFVAVAGVGLYAFFTAFN